MVTLPSIDTGSPAAAGLGTTPQLGGDGAPDVSRLIEISAAQSDFGDFIASLPVSLSPAMIMAMLQRRMSGLDHQIQASVSAMEDQQATLVSLQEKAEIIMALQAASGRTGEIGLGAPVIINGETKLASEWIRDAGIQMGVNSPDDDHTGSYYKPENLRAAGESIQSEIKRVNQGNELKMMDIQSLMQQRSSEISLATNMLKSVQDGTDAIVRNIG